MSRRRVAVRVAAVAIVLASAATLVGGFAAAGSGGTEGHVTEEGQTVAPPADGLTVVATDSNTWLGRESQGPRANAQLFAVDGTGTVVYRNDSHSRYWDVDPVAGTNATVEYVYADHLSKEACGGEVACTRNGIERVNLTTGETTAVYSRVTGGKHSTRWHDTDRIDDDHVVIADIAQDRVAVVNTTSEIVTWAWDAQSEFPVASSGGPYPSDWTHLNDVEVLSDGRIMVSLRNHDQVVFLDRETGLQENWTLGSDGDHETIYEQHNPDYINASNGGPAVVVADSENGRLVEYQREDGDWRRSWSWSDDRLQWPRDADRLPNGNTLVTDSNGNRVLEVDESGEVVWSLDVAFPYEAERLGTGDESADGPSAASADLASGGDGSTTDGDDGDGQDQSGVLGPLRSVANSLTQGPLANAVAYVLPIWMDSIHVLALVALVATLIAWAGLELYWSGYGVSLRRPLRVVRR